MTGRPTLYTEDLGLEILGRMAEGETLTEICADEAMPSRSSVYRWGERQDGFRDAFARAREAQSHAIAESGFIRARDAKDPALDRLAFDGAKWFASKMNPRTYGEKVSQEISGPNGGPVASTTIITDDPIEAARAYQRLMGRE